jgi:hypothetical protein
LEKWSSFFFHIFSTFFALQKKKLGKKWPPRCGEVIKVLFFRKKKKKIN